MALNNSHIRRAVLVCLSAALVLIMMTSGTGVMPVNASQSARPLGAEVLQIGQLSIEADSIEELGNNLVRLEGNVRIGNFEGTFYSVGLGVSSSITVDRAQQIVVDVVVAEEARLLGVGASYPLLATSATINPAEGLVTFTGTMFMPQGTMDYIALVDGTYRVGPNSRVVTMEVRVEDAYLERSWPVATLELNIGESFWTSCLTGKSGFPENVQVTDGITLRTGARLSLCPAKGNYMFDLDLSGLMLDFPDEVTGVEVSWTPSPVQEFHIELDTPSHSVTFLAEGEVQKLIPGADALPLGLTVGTGTVLTWDPWTWSGNADIAFDLPKKVPVLHITAESVSFTVDFTNRRFDFTKQTDLQIGELFGLRFAANEFHINLQEAAYIGNGTLYKFEGSLNPLGGTQARTSFRLDLGQDIFGGGFEHDFSLFNFTILGRDGTWSWSPGDCPKCVSLRGSMQILETEASEVTLVVTPYIAHGLLHTILSTPLGLIDPGATFTQDFVGLTLTIDIGGIEITLIKRPDGEWEYKKGVFGTASGLRYLRDRHARYANGSWSNDVGVTSLATLAFLNFGFGEDDPDVHSAIQYILSNCKEDGSIYSDYYHRTYHTSMAILALKATRNYLYNDEIETAKNWLVASQWDDSCLWGSVNESHWYWGGFGYGRNTRPDLSNTQWALLGLNAAGLPKDDPAWDKALTFVSRCQNWPTNDQSWAGSDGGFIYHPGSSLAGGTLSYGSMTGAGMWGLALCGLEPTEGRFAAGLDWVSNNYSWDYNPRTGGSWGNNGLYYYYVSLSKALTMARRTHVGGHDWFYEMASKLIDLQHSDGHWVNSNTWAWEGNPELVTAYAVLSLETRTLNPGEDLYLAIILHSPADLHLYDAYGRHTGMNYETGEVDLEIPGSSYSSDDPQTITVVPPAAGNYTVQLVGTEGGTYELEIIGKQDQQIVSAASYVGSIAPGELQGTFLNVTAIEGALTIFSTPAEALPALAVDPSTLNLSGRAGETVEAGFTVRETGGSRAIQGINIFSSDLIGSEGGIIPSTNITFEPSSFDLEAGASRSVAIGVYLDPQLAPGTYSGNITVESLNAGAKSVRLVIEVVSNLPPSVEAGPDQTADEGDTVDLAPATFTDPDIGDTHTASIDWGDGSPIETGTVSESDGSGTVSGSHIYDDNGTYIATVTVCDDKDACGEDTFRITVDNVAPTATFNTPADVDEGNDIGLSLTDPYDPSTADTAAGFEYAFDCGDGSGYGSFSSSNTAVCSTTDNGTRTVKGKIRDKDGGETEYTTSVTIHNVPPAVAANPTSQSVQYSDYIADVIFTATDVVADTMSASKSWSVDGGAFTDGLPDFLDLSDDGCGISDGTNTCTWTLSGIAGVAAGTYTVRVTVEDDDGGQTNADITLTVLPEDATVSFDDDNPVAVRVAEDGGNSGEFFLTVYVSEAQPDQPVDRSAPGDISLAGVSMSLVPVGPGGAVDGACTPGPVTSSGYDAVLPVTCSFDSVGVNAYTAQVTVGGGYYTGAAEDVLTVYDPSLGFATGGGWFYWPGTSERTNFGFTMKYNKKGEKVKGNLLLIRHLPDGSIYRVKSNALYGLALGESPDPTFGWASFSGKSTYLEPGWPEPEGNYEFLVYVEDRNEPGTGVDQFWIEVKDKDRAVVPVMSMDREATDNAVALQGGNIAVPHGGGKGGNK